MAFKRVWVDHVFRGGSLVFWELRSDVDLPRPYTFTAEWGHATNGTWTPVSTEPVVDGYFAVDPEGRLVAKRLDTYYRVKLVAADSTTAYSNPVRADGGLPARDWLIARELVRKEYLYLMKGSNGERGCLLKRRIWGPVCPSCTDNDTAAVAAPRCTTCWGTGITGGYHAPVEFWLAATPRNQKVAIDTSRGTVGDTVVRGRGVAYPYPLTGDLWVSADRDRRWRIGGVNEAAAVRGVPIAVEMELALLPASSLLYDLPLEDCGDEGSSQTHTPSCAPVTATPYADADDAVVAAADDPPSTAVVDFDW